MISFFVLNLWAHHTDFRREELSWDVGNLKWIRLTTSILILAGIVWYVIPAWSDTLRLEFNPNIFNEFMYVCRLVRV